MKKLIFTLLISFSALLLTNWSFATTKTWDGSSSNNWNTANNWTPSGVPGSADDVIININAAIVVDANATINSLTISGSATVSFTSSGSSRTLTIDNNGSSIGVGSILTLKGSTGTGTRSMGISFSGTNRTMSISGTLILSAVGDGSIYTATNSLTTVTGTLTNDGSGTGTRGSIISTSSNLTFSSGGTYLHSVNGVAIPTATWDPNSTANITGVNGTSLTGLNQTFGSIIWNCALQQFAQSFPNTGTMSIAGSLNVINTNSKQLQMNQSPLTISGNCTINSNFRISATLTSRTLNVNGNFILSGGTLDMSDVLGVIGTLNIGGDFSISGGTLTESGSGSGAVVFNKSGTQIFSKTGGTISNTINFTVNNGSTLDMGTSVLNGSNGSFTTLSGSTIKFGSNTGADGNITVTGSKNFNSGTNYEFNGGNSQTTGTIFPGTCNDLKINNSNGITLSSGVIVSGTLNMLSGNITTGANVLSLGSSTSVRGTLNHSSGQIITGSTGGFKRWFTNATVSGVLFPVGTSTNINIITLSFTGAPSAGGSLTAKFIASDPGTNSVTPISDAGYTVDAYSSRGYWQIDAVGLTGGTYNISFRGQGFNPLGNEITNFPKLRILKRSSAGNDWTVEGTHLDASQFSNSDPEINRTGLSGFSQFAMGGSSADGNPLVGPLPVELTSFTSNVNGRNILLNWTTATETNNSGFEIEKQYSESGQYSDWQKIGFVTGSGTKSTPTNYSYYDSKLNAGKHNYRLKQIDYNGNFEYFNLNNEVVIGNPDKFNVSQNYPNPFNPTTKIDYNIPLDSKVTIKIYDISGKEVKTLVNETKQAGYYTVEFSGIGLSSGMYFYRLTAGSFTDVKKMLMIK